MKAREFRKKLIIENKLLIAQKRGLLLEMDRIISEKNEIISGLLKRLESERKR